MNPAADAPSSRPLLAHTLVGDGAQWVVLLHGFLGSGRNVLTLAKQLSARRPDLTLVLPDLTGHGTSPPFTVEPNHGLEQMAQDVLTLARPLAPTPLSDQPIAMVGHSMGGRVALQARLLAPGEVGAVVLLDIGASPMASTATSDTRQVAQLLADAPARGPDRQAFKSYFLGRGLSPALADWLLTNLVRGESEAADWTWRFDRQALLRLHDGVGGIDLRAALGPATHCFYGDRSGYVSEAERAALSAAGVQVQAVENAGHFVHVDNLPGLLKRLEGVAYGS